MLTMHEANEIVRLYKHFQPLTSTCWQPLYWFLQGLMVNHADSEWCYKVAEEYFESYANDPENPSGHLVEMLRNSPLMLVTDFEARTVYARTKVLYYYLNNPEVLPSSVKVRRLPNVRLEDVTPLGNWDVVVIDEGRFFWLDGEWVWCGRE